MASIAPDAAPAAKNMVKLRNMPPDAAYPFAVKYEQAPCHDQKRDKSAACGFQMAAFPGNRCRFVQNGAEFARRFRASTAASRACRRRIAPCLGACYADTVPHAETSLGN